MEIVNALLDRGADVYEKDNLQKTPLYYAIINRQEDTVEDIERFLKSKVVDTVLQVNKKITKIVQAVS
ncbi:ankyrin repeat domain-containing protein [Wolbachia endosymbiont (group B) of Eucosma cana]|uniref:ankyrin repeat domain-containing protein n=1 Tax=Wolbachia endosymbiont (group B) of Eucosma cana TaxID=2954012 RepID=UPI00222778E8|nr:ankyrin repeat domain-containing protein [Wolbachia endosymbiont (group B) of Eucosma cana]